MSSNFDWESIRPCLSDVGSVASVVGLLASGYVVYTVWRLRNRFMFTARMPEVFKALGQCSKEVSVALGGLPASKRELDAVLARSCVLVTSAERLSNGTTTNSAGRLRKEIAKVRRNWNVDALWNVYSEIQGLLEELKQQLRDSKWDKS